MLYFSKSGLMKKNHIYIVDGLKAANINVWVN